MSRVQPRTWPYGTRKQATVEDRRETASGTVVLVLIDEGDEYHILAGCGDGQAGDEGTIVFTEGGPTGGYWRFERGEG